MKTNIARRARYPGGRGPVRSRSGRAVRANGEDHTPEVAARKILAGVDRDAPASWWERTPTSSPPSRACWVSDTWGCSRGPVAGMLRAVTSPSLSSRSHRLHGSPAPPAIGRRPGTGHPEHSRASAGRAAAARDLGGRPGPRGAGISRPTFYFYFQSKESVVLSLLRPSGRRGADRPGRGCRTGRRRRPRTVTAGAGGHPRHFPVSPGGVA